MIQSDDAAFGTRLPCCHLHLVEYPPLHWFVPTQPVRFAVPDGVRRIEKRIGCEAQRQRNRFRTRNRFLIGGPDNRQAIRVFPLGLDKVLGSIHAQQRSHGVSRPDVRAAERRLAAQTARLGAAQAARYPSIALSGSLGLEALTFGALDASGAATRSMLGGITAPIFDSGRITANIEIQDALVEQARLAYRAAVLRALEDVENALVALANTDERRSQLARATDSARETLAIAEQRYTSGLVSFLSVLDSQRTLLNLEDQLAASTGELAGANIRLYKALGGGYDRSNEGFE
ncbi:MAG TPA: TolC family protein [Burkholderiaceae bacterium]|nr:TolC family protein [Burkholderiaceae bacterium]